MKYYFLLLVFCMSCSFASETLKESSLYPKKHLSKELLCDVEMILNGGFSPLEGFMGEEDYHSVLDNLHLANGALWPMPIVLPVEKNNANVYLENKHITILDEQSYPIAILDIEQIYRPDVEKEAKAIYGCLDESHPMVRKILNRRNSYYVSGKLRKISLPHHFDFMSHRLTPKQCKEYFAKKGWKTIVGFQTRNPLHKSHVALTKHCMSLAGEDTKLLLHPVVGTTQPGDISYLTRVKCYQKLLKYYNQNEVLLSLLPLSMRMAGPREAMWHALIRKNYGCTHFIVGRDHAGPSVRRKDGQSFFGPYDAHNLLEKYKDELGITIIPSVEIVYDRAENRHVPVDEVSDSSHIARISGTKFRAMLQNDDEIPSWFSYPDVIDLLKQEYKRNKGTCIYFIGLSGCGKTSLCLGLKQYLESIQDAPVILIDGDVIRKYLSNELGFSKKDRSINVQRIGYIASLIAESGGICLCANIAPYEADRLANRELISKKGNYLEVFVDTPLSICEERDVKGLYLAAREGKIQNFTGVSDPFEEPKHADITIDASTEVTASLKKLVEQLNVKAPYLFTR